MAGSCATPSSALSGAVKHPGARVAGKDTPTIKSEKEDKIGNSSQIYLLG